MSRHKTGTAPFPPTDSRSRSAPRPAGRRGDPPARRVLSRAVSALAVMFLAAGCDDDPVENGEPPDLTGTYELVSLKQGTLSPVSPPAATGSFSVKQTSVTGGEASGTVALKITIALTDPPSEIEDPAGTYKNRYDGTWEQSGVFQTKGTYTLSNDTLTVMVTEPASAVSTTVWKR